VEEVVVLKWQLADQLEGHLRAVDLGDRDGAVEGDDRGGNDR